MSIVSVAGTTGNTKREQVKRHMYALLLTGAGEFSVMEFSGAESYHTSYCHFMDDDGAINLIVFRLDDSFEDQLSQVTYWMNYLKSRLPVSEPIGEYRRLLLCIGMSCCAPSGIFSFVHSLMHNLILLHVLSDSVG